MLKSKVLGAVVLAGCSALLAEVNEGTVRMDTWFNQAVEQWIDGLQKAYIKVTPIAQDWANLCYGEDILHYPLKSCGRTYTYGFGTHANSRIRIQASKPLKRLLAIGAICESEYTAKYTTSISPMVYSVEADGKVLGQSEPVPYGQQAQLDVPLKGATTFDLVIHGINGINNAHVNWLDPVVETEDGKFVRLVNAVNMDFPVSFNYGGLSAADFITKNGLRSTKTETDRYTVYELCSESETLSMTMTCKTFRNYPALEYHIAFDNKSGRRSERLSNVRSLKKEFVPENAPRILLHRGSEHNKNEEIDSNNYCDSFRPVWWTPTSIKTDNPRDELHIAGVGGRPSVDWMPYFDLVGNSTNWRIVVGWAGQWNANAVWDGTRIAVDAGIETFDAVLEPGEHLEFPSIILQRTEEGGREAAVNIWRRFMSSEIMLPVDGKPPVTPVSIATWGGCKESFHLNKIERMKQENLPLDVYWIDAGWFAPESLNEFDKTWSRNVGDWNFDSDLYPDEMVNIADALHRNGRKFLLWFEPERVRTDRRLAKEHPEYLIFNDSEDALLNLGNPEAWQYNFDTMSRIIEKNKLDWFRIDFNFSPLPYWRSCDAPDRQGITEVLYVNGLYKFWREICRKFPGLKVDNCASGGRRLDFELLRYSIPLWHSDMHCWENFEQRFSLTHLAGLHDYLPRFSGGTQNPMGGDTYNFRTSINHGVVIHCGYTTKYPLDAYPFQWLRERLAEFNKVRDCYAGDFYELAQPSPEETSWAVFQFDLPGENRGLINVFRGETCLEIERIIRPRKLRKECNYLVSDTDNSFPEFRISGADLMEKGFSLRMEEPRTARMIQYQVIE